VLVCNATPGTHLGDSSLTDIVPRCVTLCSDAETRVTANPVTGSELDPEHMYQNFALRHMLTAATQDAGERTPSAA